METCEQTVAREILERAEVGLAKYGKTMERNDLTTIEWLNHAQKEAMDFCVYLEKLKRVIPEASTGQKPNKSDNLGIGLPVC